MFRRLFVFLRLGSQKRQHFGTPLVWVAKTNLVYRDQKPLTKLGNNAERPRNAISYLVEMDLNNANIARRF